MGRFPNVLYEPAMAELPLATRLLERDRHGRGCYSAVQQPETGQGEPTSATMPSPSS